MIYLLLSGVCAFFGLSCGLGSATLLRPLLDAVSPLMPASVSALAAITTLAAALISAFFALNRPLPLDQDELILLTAGALIGGILGELACARFYAVIGLQSARLLQNALLFALIALPAVYFSKLSQSIPPMALSRVFSLPVSALCGLLGSFLSFGAQPLTLTLYFLLFNADDDEAAGAALTVTLLSMTGKIVTFLIREHFSLPDAGTLLWLLPGAMIGTLLAMIPGLYRPSKSSGRTLLHLSLFTSALNMAGSLL